MSRLLVGQHKIGLNLVESLTKLSVVKQSISNAYRRRQPRYLSFVVHFL
jgi:hypothetical protein